MKQFNLDEYNRLKAEGKEPRIVTRDGRSVRIICTDIKDRCYPICSLIHEQANGHDYENVVQVGINGNADEFDNDDCDLFFADLEEEPKYRPYDNAEECFADVKKHGGWVKKKKKERAGNCYRFIYEIIDCGVMFHDFDGLYKYYIWADDNTPCGVKEG